MRDNIAVLERSWDFWAYIITYMEVPMIQIALIKENLARARETILEALYICGQPEREVRIMAVTKTHPPEVVQAVLDAGAKLIGENRVSEGGRKIKAVGRDSAEFHMIGPLHTGEVRQAIRDFHAIDSVDRLIIAEEIARRTVQQGKPAPEILLEVNTSGEGTKYGFAPEPGLLEEIVGILRELGLDVSGFLTVGPLVSETAIVRRAFALLRELRDTVSRSSGLPLHELSMGMSDDFQLAVIEGATTVRLGRYLFGVRNR